MGRWAAYRPIDPAPMRLVPWFELNGVIDMGMNLFDPLCRERLDPLISESEVIMLDNFDSLTMRSGDEDYRGDERNWALMFDWMRKWARQGKSWVVVMHATKGGQLAIVTGRQ